MAEYKETTFMGQPCVELSNDVLSLKILPESGGEIVSIVNRKTGYDCAFFKPDRVFDRNYAAPYLKSAAGFDELFPNIGETVYPEYPWAGVPMPDKGEIWTLKMETRKAEIDGAEIGIRQSCGGVRFPYIFERTISLIGSCIEFNYSVRNNCGHDFNYQWSVQPHFRLHDGDRIEVPAGTSFYVDFSFNEEINDNSVKHSWPKAGSCDFSGCGYGGRRDGIKAGGEKLYLTGFPEKKVVVASPESGQKYTYRFDDPSIDHCGIWIDRAVWPDDDPDTLIAVGPSNCLSDGFEESVKKGAVGTLQANGENCWAFRIIIEEL